MSPTVQTLFIGFVMLGLFIGAGRFMAGAYGLIRAVRVFFFVWLGYCAWHMSVGMSHGYSFINELPFLLLNFAVPAFAGWLIYKRWGRV